MTTTVNPFEQAARQKLRFPTLRGEQSVEVLWDMPLSSKSGFDLDSVAKAVNSELKQQAEESFVHTSTNPRKATLELQLELVKYIITSKQAELAAREAATANHAKRQKLLSILSQKEDAALENLTPEELKAQIQALS